MLFLFDLQSRSKFSLYTLEPRRRKPSDNHTDIQAQNNSDKIKYTFLTENEYYIYLKIT